MDRVTVKRGTVEVKTARQHRYLHAAGLDHTHVSRTGRGTRHAYTKRQRRRLQRRLRRGSSRR